MMNNFPLVSVIIPLYNAEKYIGKTVVSILNQTYKNIEIIIIDDGSTDGSYELVKEFNAPNIIITKNNCKGACAARNYGFDLSTGDYIQYLDADDLLSPDKIEKQVALLLKYNLDCVASCQWGRFYGSKDTFQWEKQLIDKDYDDPVQWLVDSWLGGGMGQTSIWLTPRTLIEEAGSWKEDLQINQDGEFFCRVLIASKRICFVKDCGVYYRSGLSNSISKMNNRSKEKAKSLLKSYQFYRKYIESSGISSNLKTALGNNFLMFMYQYHSIFPDLSAIAENEFFAMGHNQMWPVGGLNFRKIAKLIGFKNALRIKSFASTSKSIFSLRILR